MNVLSVPTMQCLECFGVYEFILSDDRKHIIMTHPTALEFNGCNQIGPIELPIENFILSISVFKAQPGRGVWG